MGFVVEQAVSALSKLENNCGNYIPISEIDIPNDLIYELYYCGLVDVIDGKARRSKCGQSLSVCWTMDKSWLEQNNYCYYAECEIPLKYWDFRSFLFFWYDEEIDKYNRFAEQNEAYERVNKPKLIFFDPYSVKRESAPIDDDSIEIESAPAVPVADVPSAPADDVVESDVESASADDVVESDVESAPADSKRGKATEEQIQEAIKLLDGYFKSSRTDCQQNTIKQYLKEKLGIEFDLSSKTKLGKLYAILYERKTGKLPRGWILSKFDKVRKELEEKEFQRNNFR